MIEVGRELVDPVLVATLLSQPIFVSLVGAIRKHDVRNVKIISAQIEDAGFSSRIIIAALERVAE